MHYIIAVDPGPRESGVVVYQPGTYKVHYAEVLDNLDVPSNIHALHRLWNASAVMPQVTVAIEFPCFYGKSVSIGKDVLETAAIVGRFEALVLQGHTRTIRRITRREVRMTLCGTMRAGDPQVWAAICDRYGGRAAAIGNKKNPGPLYGVKSHARSALAVAITAAEMQA